MLTDVIAVSAGGAHALALRTDGTIMAWGNNLNGAALGYSTEPASRAEGSVRLQGEVLRDIIAVAASCGSDQESFSLALRGEGTVRAWGGNSFGQTTVPADLNSVVAISAGYLQALALRKDGTIVSWGQGQPPPAGLSNVVAIAAGGESGRNVALKSDGTVVDWPVISARYGSTVPPGLSNVVAISAGRGHSLALTADGRVVGWGDNWLGGATGAPGPGPDHDSAGPVAISGQALVDAVSIAAGNFYSLAVKKDGTVVMWGRPPTFFMRLPDALSGVVAISAGYDFSLAITTNNPGALAHPRWER